MTAGIVISTAITSITACSNSKSLNSIDNFFENSSIVIIEKNEPHYEETIYYKNADEFFNDRTSYGIITRNKISMAKNKSLCSSNTEDINGDFVIGAKKFVCIEEIYNDNNEIISSRLLSEDEINSNHNNSPCASLIGTNTTSKFYLEIDMKVIYDGTYLVVGDAYWSSEQVWGGEKHPEDSADDFMGLTWGGNGELKQTYYEFNGYYRDSTAVTASTCISDTYSGYCWQFREKTGLWVSALESASCFARLQKTYSDNKNKETNAKFTYIHTYNHITPTVGLSVGTSGVAGSFSVSGSSSAWQLQIDVPGLKY